MRTAVCAACLMAITSSSIVSPPIRWKFSTFCMAHATTSRSCFPTNERQALQPRRDGIRDRDRAPRHVGMHALEHAAVELDHAFGMIFRQFERSDDLARLGNIALARRKGRIARRNLVGMNQRLAVEAHVASLAALAAKTLLIGDVVIDPVQ